MAFLKLFLSYLFVVSLDDCHPSIRASDFSGLDVNGEDGQLEESLVGEENALPVLLIVVQDFVGTACPRGPVLKQKRLVRKLCKVWHKDFILPGKV